MGDGDRHFTSLKNRIHAYVKYIDGKKAMLPLFILSDIDGIAANLVSYEGDTSLKIVPGHKNVFTVHLDVQNLGANAGYMLVDLSDIINWPHTNVEHIVLEWFTVNINPSTAFRGDVSIGFLKNVDTDNGDLCKVHSWHLDQAALEIVDGFNHSGHGLDLSEENSFLPVDVDDVTWQTDINLIGPAGGAAAHPAGDGDFVMKVVRTAGNVDISISCGYTTRS